MRKRLELARKLLLDGHSIQHAAHESGYRHASNFTTAFGRASAGGLVALSSKRLEFEHSGQLRLGVGNSAQKNVAFDLTGPVEEERYAFAPQLTWDMSDATSLTLYAYLQKYPEGGYHSGVPYEGAVDNQLEAELSTGAVFHTLLFGADYQRRKNDVMWTAGAFPVIDAFNPQYGAEPIGDIGVTNDDRHESSQAGVYIQDQMAISNWQLSLDGLAPYVSYSTAFTLTSFVDASDDLLELMKGKQLETGVKFQPDGSRDRYSTALFHIDQENVATKEQPRELCLQTDRANTEQVPDYTLVHAALSYDFGRIGIEGVAARDFLKRYRCNPSVLLTLTPCSANTS